MCPAGDVHVRQEAGVPSCRYADRVVVPTVPGRRDPGPCPMHPNHGSSAGVHRVFPLPSFPDDMNIVLKRTRIGYRGNGARRVGGKGRLL
jgi:hypothetical protein